MENDCELYQKQVSKLPLHFWGATVHFIDQTLLEAIRTGNGGQSEITSLNGNGKVDLQITCKILPIFYLLMKLQSLIEIAIW